jgi:predicted AlkP superfamily phosphohydrolase/phosphomutase
MRRLGFLAEGPPTDMPPEPAGAGEGVPDGAVEGTGAGGGVLRRVRDSLPKDLRKSLARRLPTSIRDFLARRVDNAHIAWDRTRAFCLPTDLEGCIRVNLRGREPSGIVAPEDYDALCAEIAEALASFEDPATGRRLVKEVVKLRDRYGGDRVDHLPDLVVLWDDAFQVGEMRSGGAGLIAGPSPDRRPGTHGAAGFVMAIGPCADEIWGDVGDVRDIALAALRTFGVDAPAHLSPGDLTDRGG